MTGATETESYVFRPEGSANTYRLRASTPALEAEFRSMMRSKYDEWLHKVGLVNRMIRAAHPSMRKLRQIIQDDIGPAAEGLSPGAASNLRLEAALAALSAAEAWDEAILHWCQAPDGADRAARESEVRRKFSAMMLLMHRVDGMGAVVHRLGSDYDLLCADIASARLIVPSEIIRFFCVGFEIAGAEWRASGDERMDPELVATVPDADKIAIAAQVAITVETSWVRS